MSCSLSSCLIETLLVELQDHETLRGDGVLAWEYGYCRITVVESAVDSKTLSLCVQLHLVQATTELYCLIVCCVFQ